MRPLEPLDQLTERFRRSVELGKPLTQQGFGRLNLGLGRRTIFPPKHVSVSLYCGP